MKTNFSITGVGDPDEMLKAITSQYGEETLELHPITVEASERENDRLRVAPHILDLKYQEKCVIYMNYLANKQTHIWAYNTVSLASTSTRLYVAYH